MSNYKESFTLNNGLEIPSIGIGMPIIAKLTLKEIIYDIYKNRARNIRKLIQTKKIVRYSIRNGIIMFDSARAYGISDKILGKVTKNKFQNSFIITKISNADQRNGDIRKVVNEILNEIHKPKIDLLLIHWPQPETYINTWLQMEELYNEGIIRAIGVSNFHQHHIEELLSVANIIPAVNEIELHPLLNQKELIQFNKRNGIQTIAYTPLGRMTSKITNNQTLILLSNKYKKSIPQIILRWNYQNRVISIPYTSRKNRVIEYNDIYDFVLSEVEMTMIDEVNENIRIRFDPDNCDFDKL